jgi:hypothetical protein
MATAKSIPDYRTAQAPVNQLPKEKPANQPSKSPGPRWTARDGCGWHSGS